MKFMISNLTIVKEILHEELPEYKFSFIELFKLSRKDNMKNYYIGDKIKSYYKPNYVSDVNGNVISGIVPKTRTSLFRHEENDIYYYDVLENNTEYEMVSANYTYAHNICVRMKSLEEKVKKIRWKEEI